jgi:hypothetical protein
MKIPNRSFVRLTAAIVLVSVTVLSCTGKEGMPAGYKRFSALPIDEQAAEFEGYSISKQVDYFIYEYNHVHPFHNSFASSVAARGDEATPYLLQRLAQEPDRNKLAILYIIKIMFEDGHLQNRSATLSEIKEEVSAINDPAIKALAEERVRSFMLIEPPTRKEP